ncbi:hypothetical protein BGZ72_008322 [Mortierella alpina]|nr:hypothetical protein BGZ72_008322 [Mortierella alpina]
MSKWQLDRKLDTSARKGNQFITMEVRLSKEALFSQLVPGSIEIHFLELNSRRPKSLGLNASLSGNGKHMLTLSATTKQLILELWDCEDSKDPQPHYPFLAALSWDASQIVVIYTGFYHKEPPLLPDFQDYFGLYRSTKAFEYLPSVADYRRCSELHNFGGAAKFHVIEPVTQGLSDELFIATDGNDIQIYNVHGDWRLLRVITLLSSEKLKDDALFAWDYIRSLHGRYFQWYDNYNNTIVFWDITTGAVVSAFPRKGPWTMWTLNDDAITSISDDGSVLAFYRQGELITYRIASGTFLQSSILPPSYQDVSEMRFIRQNSQLLISTGAQDEEFGPGKLGLVVDTATLSIQDRFLVPSGELAEWTPRYGNDTQLYIITQDAISLVEVEDYIVHPYTGRYLMRHNQCTGPLAPVSKQPATFTPAGLSFTAEIINSARSLQKSSPSVVVRVSNSSGRVRTFTIPPLPDRPDCTGEIDDKRKYIVISPVTLMIWALPTSFEGDFSLLLAWSTARLPSGNAWVICPHEQLYYSSRTLQCEGGAPVLYPDADHPFTNEHADHFLDGLAIAMELFETADDACCRQAILGYVSSHINNYPVSGDPAANVMSKICSTWTLEFHEMQEHFTAALLSPGYARWIPRLDMDRPQNPLCILLEKCKKEPRAIGLLEIIIDYCIRQERDDKDPIFLLPITQCLGDIAARKKQHWDLALRTLQQLAYLPVRNRGYIVDNHQIAYPVGSLLKFWKQEQLPIYKCKDPVLQLRSDKVAIECHDLTLDTFDNPALAALIEYKWQVERLFELRINRSVCHYVTIIIRIFSEIRVFFLIFAGGILAFTIAIMHLLYACLGDKCPEPIDGGFPLHFYQAVSSTYFFMGGRYDSINSDLDSDSWAFHTMMIIYFFFTVILMLNVLIGLVNLAFNDGDRTWRLVWLKNRLRYIESAENLSYRVPGLRQAYNCFPNEIYYSSTPQTIAEYRKRCFGEDGKCELKVSTAVLQTPTGPRAARYGDTATMAGDQKYEETSKESQEMQTRSFEQLRKQLKDEFKRELQEQLEEQRKEQQQLFESQIKMLQEHMSALMKSGS